MSKQYFENNENLKSEPFTFEFYFKKNILKFKSDNGVFSKKNVDFGSSLLLKNLIVMDNDRILDVGCGIGIMGITIAKSNPNTFVEMIDVNLRAISLCKENCATNGCLNTKVYESNIYQNVINQFDLIISNPPIRAGKKIVHEILIGSYEKLKSNGRMYAVIQKKQGAESAIKVLNEVFDKVEIINKDNGYFIIKCTKI